MPDNNTLIAVSAFSGLAGAILTQTLTGLFAYFADKRKTNMELKNQYRGKQTEIAENYYYVTGETMAILRKSVQFWKGRSIARSEASYKSMTESLSLADTRLRQMMIDHWKHTLIGLYFHVALSYDELIAANNLSHERYLKVLDMEEKIRNAADEEEREKYTGRYSVAIFELCNQYDNIYDILGKDMERVRIALLAGYHLRP